MKVWKFFKIPEDVKNDQFPLEEKYPLYAYTPDKRLAKQFKRERNMKVFIESKVHMELEEFQEFVAHNRSCMLQERKFLTVVNKYTKQQREIYVTMVTTMIEGTVVEDQPLAIQDETFWNSLIPFGHPKMFNDELRKLLESIDYGLNYKIFNSDPELDPEYDDYNAPNWYIDELARLLSQYQSLFYDSSDIQKDE